MITGFLIKVVGCGKTSAFGAILTPLGYIVSYFAESVLFLIISLGVVSGKREINVLGINAQSTYVLNDTGPFKSNYSRYYSNQSLIRTPIVATRVTSRTYFRWSEHRYFSR